MMLIHILDKSLHEAICRLYVCSILYRCIYWIIFNFNVCYLLSECSDKTNYECSNICVFFHVKFNSSISLHMESPRIGCKLQFTANISRCLWKKLNHTYEIPPLFFTPLLSRIFFLTNSWASLHSMKIAKNVMSDRIYQSKWRILCPKNLSSYMLKVYVYWLR